MNYIEILKTLALAQVITTFTPISWILELLPNNLIKYILIVLSSCLKCASLWIGISIYGLWIGIVTSIIASLWTESKQHIIDYIWRRKKITN
jgi:hypothetical protein